MADLTYEERKALRRAAEDARDACNRHYGPFVDLVAHPLNILALLDMADRAALAQQPSAQDHKCQTCGGRGWIGGPSYRQPDEGGEPCPECERREDVERMAWLQSIGSVDIVHGLSGKVEISAPDDVGIYATGQTLREAIDTARAAKERP